MLKKEEYLKTVKRPYPPLFCSLICMGYVKKENYGKIVNKPFCLMNLAHVDDVWYYGKRDMEKGGELAFEAWRDIKKLEFVKKEFKKREDNLIKSVTKDFKTFAKAYGEFMPALALVFAIEKPLTMELRKTLGEKLSQQEVDDLMIELNTPLENNYHKLEEYELVTSSDLSAHVKKWEFLYARYGEQNKYTVEEAKKKLSEIDKKEFLEKWEDDKRKLKEKISYAKELLGVNSSLVDIFQYIIYYRTHRTDVMNRAAYLAIPMLNKTARKLGLNYKELLECSASEVLENKVTSKEILKQRERDCSTLLDNGEIKCLTGKKSKEIIKSFEEETNEVNEFKGQIACKGNVKGIVKIVFNKKDFDKIEAGDVLVTSMTTPEMVPIMKKASAFVTDEGGVTCHAAIISREMKKPCIIGTKNATKILKDGYNVEVNANTGVIRILEKTK